MSDDRKRPAKSGPDECEETVWTIADTVELLRRKASPAVARQAAHAGLEAVKAFEQHLPALTRAHMARQQGGRE